MFNWGVWRGLVMNDCSCQDFTIRLNPPFDFIHEHINLIEDSVKDSPSKDPNVVTT